MKRIFKKSELNSITKGMEIAYVIPINILIANIAALWLLYEEPQGLALFNYLQYSALINQSWLSLAKTASRSVLAVAIP